MDDIFLFAKTPKELEENTKRVLQHLQENNLFLKPKKCEFHKRKIEWLGMIIEEGKISMDPGKLKGISEWPKLNTVKQVRGFLGFGNFYRRFIKHYSEIAKPLNNLLKKDQKFEWTTECQEAFDNLKRCFTEEPVLIMPDHSKPSKSSATPQNTLQEPSSLNWIRMATDTHVPSSPKPFHQLKETTKSMIENYLLLFEPLKNGVTTFRAHLTQQLSSLITRI